MGYQYDKKICQAANTAEDCAQVLQRAQWLPEFDEWRYRWNFSSVKALSFWSTYEQLPKHKNWKEGNEKYAGMADTTEHLVVEYAQMLGQDARVLRRERKRDYLLKSSNSRERARRLFERGPDYLYGLLFKETFEFQPSVIVPMQPIGNTTQGSSGREKQKSVSKQEIYQSDGSNYSKESLTVVLHSRHSSTEDDGSKIKREKLCFDKIIQSQTRASLCQVLLLSDRPNTLTKAAEYLADRYPHCHVMVAPHDTGQSFRVEHGPFSGSGFFQDLSFIANQSHGIPTARTAFIGSDHRSSSMLVQEILVYQLQSRNQQTQLETCYLEHT